MTTRRSARTALLAAAAAALLAVVSSPAEGAAPSKARAQTVGSLSGTWSGQYGGAYHGTFTVHWRQTGTRLRGTIRLSNPPSSPSITGSVHGRTIRFGTVGSEAITYSGSVSGESMSGSYKTPGGGGSWTAHKTS